MSCAKDRDAKFRWGEWERERLGSFEQDYLVSSFSWKSGEDEYREQTCRVCCQESSTQVTSKARNLPGCKCQNTHSDLALPTLHQLSCNGRTLTHSVLCTCMYAHALTEN
ncbi:UNVERIFIED_CONTAM: hypothetical protein K2H54_038216 [Gekko kuhli]